MVRHQFAVNNVQVLTALLHHVLEPILNQVGRHCRDVMQCAVATTITTTHKFRKRNFCLAHPKLGEVATRVGAADIRSKARRHSVQCRCLLTNQLLQVQLVRRGQANVRLRLLLLIKKLPTARQMKHFRTTFAVVHRERWRVHVREIAI